MKKSLLVAMMLATSMTFAACSSGDAPADNNNSSETTTEDASKKSEGVMTYQEYVDADLESEVVLEAYVQDKQSWWDNKATIYAADPDGAYFIYNANVPEDVYEQLTPGTKIKVTGYKTEWSGEVEVAEGADIEIIEAAPYTAEAVDVTDLLGNDEELIKHQNQKVSFSEMVVEPAEEGSDVAYLYNWDGSGQDGDDLYFNVSKDGKTYSFVVESYLRGADTDVYNAVKDLKVGDTVNLEGFLYWYEGANPHITEVTVVE